MPLRERERAEGLASPRTPPAEGFPSPRASTERQRLTPRVCTAKRALIAVAVLVSVHELLGYRSRLAGPNLRVASGSYSEMVERSVGDAPPPPTRSPS